MPFGAGQIVYEEDFALLQQASTLKPVGRLVANATQSLPNGLTQTAILFATEEIDTHNFHSTASNTARVTPTVAGIYRFTGTVFMGNSMAGLNNAQAVLRKNGSSNIAPASRSKGYTDYATDYGTSALVEMNGTTDYIELTFLHNATAASLTSASTQLSSVLEWQYERAVA